MKDNIYLYHGTTSISAFKILKNKGIQPRNISNSENEIIQTTTKQMNVVYLTKNKESAVSYGYDRTDSRGWSFKNKQIVIPVVFTIEINTNKDKLLIDEDYLIDDISKNEYAQFLLDKKIINDKSETRNWKYYLANDPDKALEILKIFPWQKSLEESDSIVFEGTVGLDRIKYIDLYYNAVEYIRIFNISMQTFIYAYKECCRFILNKYISQYKNEYKNTNVLPNPFKYSLLNYSKNKLDGVIYKNINNATILQINNFCRQYKYQEYNKIIITQFGKYIMQENTYIKCKDNINDIFKCDDYILLTIIVSSVTISYFTYIRNHMDLLLQFKDYINEFVNNKNIIFEKKYNDIMQFYNQNDFWNYINDIQNKKILLHAKKR